MPRNTPIKNVIKSMRKRFVVTEPHNTSTPANANVMIDETGMAANLTVEEIPVTPAPTAPVPVVNTNNFSIFDPLGHADRDARRAAITERFERTSNRIDEADRNILELSRMIANMGSQSTYQTAQGAIVIEHIIERLTALEALITPQLRLNAEQIAAMRDLIETQATEISVLRAEVAGLNVEINIQLNAQLEASERQVSQMRNLIQNQSVVTTEMRRTFSALLQTSDHEIAAICNTIKALRETTNDAINQVAADVLILESRVQTTINAVAKVREDLAAQTLTTSTAIATINDAIHTQSQATTAEITLLRTQSQTIINDATTMGDRFVVQALNLTNAIAAIRENATTQAHAIDNAIDAIRNDALTQSQVHINAMASLTAQLQVTSGSVAGMENAVDAQSLETTNAITNIRATAFAQAQATENAIANLRAAACAQSLETAAEIAEVRGQLEETRVEINAVRLQSRAIAVEIALPPVLPENQKNPITISKCYDKNHKLHFSRNGNELDVSCTKHGNPLSLSEAKNFSRKYFAAQALLSPCGDSENSILQKLGAAPRSNVSAQSIFRPQQHPATNSQAERCIPRQ